MNTTTRAALAACLFAVISAIPGAMLNANDQPTSTQTETRTTPAANRSRGSHAHMLYPRNIPRHSHTAAQLSEHSHPTHAHPYAAAHHSHDAREHTHAAQAHVHPYAAAQHVHEAREHTHPAQEHTHDTTPEHSHDAVAHTHDEVPEHTHEPAEPETPTEPETPAPPAQTCTYEHRLIGVPGTTANAYTGRILVSSKTPGATATIRGFHRDTGLPIDVLDSEGDALTGPVSLDPARSVKRFSIEAVTGWHPVTVEHPSESAMQAATVAMRVREPGGSIVDSYPPEREHCQPATGTETTGGPDLRLYFRGPDLLRAGGGVLTWRVTIANLGDATAPIATVRLYYGERLLDMYRHPRETPATHAFRAFGHLSSREGIPHGATLRICVDTVPPEPESKRANNCTTRTITESPYGRPSPDLAVRDAQALLWPNTLDWRATVENIGDATAPRTTIRLYHGARELATQDVRRELAAGSQWPMSHAVSRAGATTVPDAGATVRICVDAVPDEPESKRANNCATVTVELN